jgi:hypothetical protein
MEDIENRLKRVEEELAWLKQQKKTGAVTTTTTRIYLPPSVLFLIALALLVLLFR